MKLGPYLKRFSKKILARERLKGKNKWENETCLTSSDFIYFISVFLYSLSRKRCLDESWTQTTKYNDNDKFHGHIIRRRYYIYRYRPIQSSIYFIIKRAISRIWNCVSVHFRLRSREMYFLYFLFAHFASWVGSRITRNTSRAIFHN